MDDINEPFQSVEHEIISIRKDIRRIFEHHQRFDTVFHKINETHEKLRERIDKEKDARIEGDSKLSDQHKETFGSLYRSVASAVFVSLLGLITFLIQLALTTKAIGGP